MNGSRGSVELQMAYHWHCDECGQSNFSMPIKAEFALGEKEEAFRKVNEVDEWSELPDGWQDFECVTLPDTVSCSRCGTEFDTVDERYDSSER